VSFGKALAAAGIAGVSAFATSYFAPGGTGSQLGSGTKVIIGVATNALANVATSYWVMGVRNPSDLWRTAAAGAVSGLLPSGPSDSSKIVGRVLIASALNVAAARIEGVKKGNQLLLVGALSGAAAYASSKFNSKDSTGGETPGKFKQFSKVLVGTIIGVGVGRVIGHNFSGAGGQALAGFAATLAAQITTANGQLTMGKDGSKEFQSKMPEFNKAFSQALKSGINGQYAHDRQNRPQISVSGPGVPDPEEQQRKEEKRERARYGFSSSILDSAVSLGQNPMGLASFLTGGFVSVVSGLPTALLAPGQTIKDAYSSPSEVMGSDSVVLKDNTSRTFSDDNKSASLLSEVNREDVAYMLVSYKDNNPSIALTQKEMKAALESISGVKFDAGALKEIGDKTIDNGIAKVRAEGFNVDQVLGIRINGKAVALLMDNEKGIVGTIMENSTGQKELRTFSFTMEEGKVVKAEGKIFKEINGKFEQSGSFELLRGTRATAEVQKFTKEHVNNKEIADQLAKTQSVYSERDMSGQRVRTVFLGKYNGETVALASEHATFDETGKATGYFLRTYDYKDAGLSSTFTKGGEIVAKGKVFDQSAEGTYTDKTRAEFEMARLTGSALVNAKGTAGAVAAALSLGGHQGGLLVYQEKDLSSQKFTQTVIMDEKTGSLKAVAQQEQDGRSTITVFSKADVNKIKQSSDGLGDVRYLGDMSMDEQTHFQNSIAVMGKHDSAIMTEMTSQIQESIISAMSTKKLGEAFGMDTKDVFLALPEGMATKLGLPEGAILNVTNMRMDKNNEVILEGTLAGKNLESEKNFILVGSASDMAATLGQGNDTKGAQLLLVQEKDGFRAVTYLPDGNEQGGIRLLGEGTGLTPDTVRAALNKSELVGGVGAKPGILERAAETAGKGLQKVLESIPGAKPVLRKVIPNAPHSPVDPPLEISPQLNPFPLPGLRLLPLGMGQLGFAPKERHPGAMNGDLLPSAPSLVDYAYSLFLEPLRASPSGEMLLAWAGVSDAPILHLRFNETEEVNVPSLLALPEADISSLAVGTVFEIDRPMRVGDIVAFAGPYKKLANGEIEPQAGAVYQKGEREFVTVATEDGKLQTLSAQINHQKGKVTYQLKSFTIVDGGKSETLSLGNGGVEMTGTFSEGIADFSAKLDQVTLNAGGLRGAGTVQILKNGYARVEGILRGTRDITVEIGKFGKPGEGPSATGEAKTFNNKIDRIYKDDGRIKAEGEHVLFNGEVKSLGEGTQFKLDTIRLALNGVIFDRGGSTSYFEVSNGSVLVPDQGLSERVTPLGRVIEIHGYTKDERKSAEEGRPTHVLAQVTIDPKGKISAVGQDGTTKLAARAMDGSISVMTMDGQDYQLGFSGGARLKNSREEAPWAGFVNKIKNTASQFMDGAKPKGSIFQKTSDIITFGGAIQWFAKKDLESTLYHGEAVGRNLVDVSRTMSVKMMNGLGKGFKEVSQLGSLGSLVTGGPVLKAGSSLLGVDLKVPSLGDLTGWTQVEKTMGVIGVDLPQAPSAHGIVAQAIQGVDFEKGLEWAEDRMGILGQYTRDQGWGVTAGVKVATLVSSVVLETPHFLFGLSSDKFYEANGGFAKGKGMEIVNGVFNAFMFAGGIASVAKGGLQRGMLWLMSGPRAYAMEGTFAVLGTHGVIEVWKGDDSFKGKVVDTVLIAAPVFLMLRARAVGEMHVRKATAKGNAGLLELTMDSNAPPLARQMAAERLVKNTGLKAHELEALVAGPARTEPLMNALPEDGLYARVVSESRANDFLNRNREFAGMADGELMAGGRLWSEGEAFIASYGDLKGINTPQGLAKKLTLMERKAGGPYRDGMDTVIVFERPPKIPVATPVNGALRGYGNTGGGLTKGLVREWVMQNGTRVQLEGKGLKIKAAYTVDGQGRVFEWKPVVKKGKTFWGRSLVPNGNTTPKVVSSMKSSGSSITGPRSLETVTRGKGGTLKTYTGAPDAANSGSIGKGPVIPPDTVKPPLPKPGRSSPSLNLVNPGETLAVLEGLRSPGRPSLVKTEMLRQLRAEVVNPYLETKLVLRENFKRLGWKVEEGKLREMSGRLSAQPDIGVRIDALMKTAPDGKMKGYLDGALKAYNESGGKMSASLLEKWEGLAVGRVSLSDASVALFGERGMFSRLKRTMGEAVSMTPAEVRVRKDGVLLRFKFQGETGELWRGDLWVTERGLKGELVDMYNAVKESPRELKKADRFVDDMLAAVDRYKAEVEVLRGSDVQNGGRGKNQPAQVERAGASAAGADIGPLSPEAQPTTPAARRVAESKHKILDQFNDSIRESGNGGRFHKEGGRDGGGVFKTRSHGNGRPFEGDNKGLRNANRNLRENLEKVLENRTTKSLRELDDSLIIFKKEFNADINTRLDLAAEKFAQVGGRDARIREIKATFDAEAAAQGSSLTAKQIESKHKAYAQELRHVLRGMDDLLATHETYVRQTAKESQTVSQFKQQLDRHYNAQAGRRQMGRIDQSVGSAFADAADGQGRLSAREKVWILVGPDRIDYVKELLDQSNSLPMRHPRSRETDYDNNLLKSGGKGK
jgi:hypothetical protein